MKRLTRPLGAAVLLALTTALGCGTAVDGADPRSSDPIPSETQESLSVSRLPLCCGTRSTLVEGIASAENLLFTSDGRLLVTSNDGIYEVRRDGTGNTQAVLITSAGGCQFTGIVEVRGVVYASCSDSSTSAVHASKLAPSLSFQLVFTLNDVVLANGLASDAAGRLYVAETLQNQILRLTVSPSDPFKITSQEVWLPGSGLFTNGMKVLRGTAYWTDFGAIKRAAILPGGGAGPTVTVASALTFFDDLYVDDQGILAADFLGGVLRAFDRLGLPIGQTPAVFTNPSSVVPANGRLGLKSTDLVVTEKGANRVAVYSVKEGGF